MTIDRTQPPALAPAQPSPFPKFERHSLANGLPVLCLERRDVPLYSLRYIGSASSTYDMERPGRALLAASVLDEGTTHRSATEIAEQIEQRGGSIGSGCDWDASFLNVGMLSQDLDFGAELLAECLLEAAFADEETERIRSRFLAELARRRDEPDALANERFSSALYHAGPYSHPPLGSAEVLAELRSEELRDFVSSHALSQSSSIVAVGDFRTDDLLERLEATFGNRARASAPDPPQPRLREIGEREIHIVDRPEAQQTVLRLGHVGVPRREADRTALVLLNSILGGKFTSRLNLNLRERHGFTYGVSSSFQFRRQAGPFVVGTSVANDVVGRAVEQTLFELERLLDEPPRQEELDDARDYLIGVFPYGLQTLSGLASRIEEIQIHDLPDDYYDTMASRLDLSAEDLHAAAKRHLRPDRSVIVAVGPRALLEPQLAALGRVVEA